MKILSRIGGLLAIVLMVGMLAGCTQTEQGAGTGAILGAGLGAVIGHQSGHAGEGAAIGAASGALLGGAVGHQKEKEAAARAGASQQVVQCPHCGGQVDVTGFAPGTKLRCPNCNAMFQV